MKTAGSPTKKPARTKLLASKLDLEQIPAQYRKQAACVLEVLAGLRTPEQAAGSLAVSLPTYYNLETRALRGLILGCAPQLPGRSLALAKKLQGAEQRCLELDRQLQRYQALLRSAQRSMALLSPPEPRTPGKRKAQKPAIRALRVVETLCRPDPAPPRPPVPTEAVENSGAHAVS